jgi:hypothetical protein
MDIEAHGQSKHMNRPAQKAEKEVPLIVVKNERERHDA